MGIFSTLFGAKGGDSSLAHPIEAIGNIIDSVYTSPEEIAAGELLKQKLALKPSLMQAEINKVQAAHRSPFVAGARPFLMWVCGFGFLFAFVINPVLQWLAPDLGSPDLPLDAMLELTLAMLGLAGLRTVEKLNGKTK